MTRRAARAVALAAAGGVLALGLKLGLGLALGGISPPSLRRAQTLSPALDDSSGRVLTLRPAADGIIRLAADPATVGPDIVPLLLAREDRRFATMPGIDPLALARAAAQFVLHGRVVSGGSTVAMQTARLLAPHPRTLIGKLRDMVRALQLEASLGRDGVLRLYLTLAPMGGNIEGVRAASLLYFGKEPAALDRDEAALLVSLPQRPAHRRPDRHPEAAWRGARLVLAAAGDVTAVTPSPVAARPVIRRPLPASARYLALHAAGPGEVATTLDGRLQRDAEALAAREAAWLGADADADADLAAVVVRNADRAILAYLGGAHPGPAGGDRDMARAVRSPGSALKPAIYALAFDDGLADPATPVDDTPFSLAGYAPRDFDRAEHGDVPAAEALRRSLNRPAVRLLARLGPARFAAALAAAGIRLRLPPGGVPSAAVALGGAGVSLLDLAALYSDLAAGGGAGSLHWRPENEAAGGAAAVLRGQRPLCGQEAARAVADVLRDQSPPAGIAADPARPIAWKTGTSYGFRDAWAVGFTPTYTVAVWTGRRDGAPRPGLTGLTAAAPVLFRLFGLLPPEYQPLLFADPGPPAPMPRAAALRRAPQPSGPRILFPPPGAEMSVDASDSIGLQATGGAPPLRWTADGVPAGTGDTAPWHPAGLGFTHLTVTDSDGRTASVDVRFVPPDAP